MSQCPICGYSEATTMREEIKHMNDEHPETIIERLTVSGFYQHPDTSEWIDLKATDD